MTDNMTPELTLDPNTAAAAETVPQLTLTPEAPEPPKVEEKKAEPVEMDDKAPLRRGEEGRGGVFP